MHPFTNCITEIKDTKLSVPVGTLSTQDNIKLLKQLETGFKRKVNWKKYLSKPELLKQDSNLKHLVESKIQGVNRLFVLAFEHGTQRRIAKGYYFPNVELKYYDVMIDGKKIL